MVVDLYVGFTSAMEEVQLGQKYPFRAGRAPQNGGPLEGIVDDAGYAECPHCDRDFFCAAEFRDEHLIALSPNRTFPPYAPDRLAEGVVACPQCGSRATRHAEFDNLAVGVLFCDNDDCDFGQRTTTWDAASGVYRLGELEIPKL